MPRVSLVPLGVGDLRCGNLLRVVLCDALVRVAERLGIGERLLNLCQFGHHSSSPRQSSGCGGQSVWEGVDVLVGVRVTVLDCVPV